MEYATEGNLHNYLQKNFAIIEWKDKIKFLYQISDGYLILNIFILFAINY
jgi:hypothetical protein